MAPHHHVPWMMMALSTSVHALNNGVAITPPMGWNSYMSGIGGELASSIRKLSCHCSTVEIVVSGFVLACSTWSMTLYALASLDHSLLVPYSR